MGYFTAFRNAPAPTMYKELHNAVTADVVEAGLLAAFCLVVFSILISAIGIQADKKRLFPIFGAVLVCYYNVCILLAIFGYGWRSGSVTTETAYRSFSNRTIHATISLNIGLTSTNITLKGKPVKQLSETIDYNEHFEFGVLQGRIGFGPQAGQITRDFRSGQYRGMPSPILWVAEYFTLDGERIRWGRDYRQAGYYTAHLMWTSLVLFFLTVATMSWALAHAACLSALTGVTLLVACAVYSGLHEATGTPLSIPFEDGVLEMSYGWSYYLTFVNGLTLLAGGITMMLLYLCFPGLLFDFLGIDLDETDEFRFIDPSPPPVAAIGQSQSVTSVQGHPTIFQIPVGHSESTSSVHSRSSAGFQHQGSGRSSRSSAGFQHYRKQRCRLSPTLVSTASVASLPSPAGTTPPPFSRRHSPMNGPSLSFMSPDQQELDNMGQAMHKRDSSISRLSTDISQALKQPMEIVSRLVQPASRKRNRTNSEGGVLLNVAPVDDMFDVNSL